MTGFKRSMRLALMAAVAVVSIFSTQSAWAVKANPKPVTYYQPDGTPFTARMIGDERIVFFEDAEGRTLVRDAETGWYLYADPASHGGARLQGTALRAGKDVPPASWTRHVRPRIDAANLPGPPRVQVDDGSVAKLFQANNQRRGGRFQITSNAQSLTPTTVPVLVILVEFSDFKHTSGPGTPIAGEPDFQPMPGQPNSAPTWQTLLGDRNVPGGLNHFYWESTYQRMQWNVTVAPRGKGQTGTGTLVNDGWYTNPNTMAYWGADKTGAGGTCNNDGGTAIKGLITWAVQQANADVNFAQYDTDGNGTISDAELMIFVIHARQGQEMYGDGCGSAPADPLNNHIWSHKWNMATSVAVDGKTIPTGHIYAIEPEFSPVFNYATNPWTLTEKYFGVGVFAHEALHTLGAPDIYDTGYDATPAGDWDLMDSGSYNGAKSGTHPAHMGGPLKQDLKLNADTDAASYGFILESEIGEVTADGAKNILGTGNGTSAANVLHRVKAPNNTNEWFMIENRAPVGYYEPFLPEHGLIIWHRDRSVSGSGNNTWPYQANVLRKAWANTATGLQADASGAAFSMEDGQTSFTATTDPHNKLNNGSASGLKDIRCISAESSAMAYAYGAVTGSHVIFAGATVSGGDGDEWLDFGETATLRLNVLNSSCAGQAASNLTAVVTSTDGVVGASLPVSISALAAGVTGAFDFSVDLGCSNCSSVAFDYTIYAGGTAVTSGRFTKSANRSVFWFDDADGQAKAGWSSASSFVPSACTTATRHGDWSLVQHPTAPRGNSYRTPVTGGVTYANPDEAWISPNITIPAGMRLDEFRFSYAAEIPCVNYTRGRLWVSTDNGVTWTRNESFFRDGGNLSWEEVSVPLAEYQGATQLRFMFAMYTYTCQTGCTAARGIYVDNVAVIVGQQSGSGDTQAPATSITSPSNGVTVSGSTTVSASASDDTGVTRVEFFVDGALASTDSSSPYSFSWDTTSASNGTHALTSKAYDAAGNSGTSASVSVTVSNTIVDTQAPATSITSPSSGATVSAIVTVSASASDNVGVTRVEFYVDGSLASTDTSAGFSYDWNTTLLANGTHTLYTKAYDAVGNVGTSATVTVTVSNTGADVLPPVISGVTSVITNSKNGSFEVRWTTNEPSTTVVIIGATRYTNTALVTSHVYAFRGTRGATYTYTIESTDAAGNTATAGPFTHQN
ncbi:MAG TPA: Ig-like domain-containing protein [Thermoanaerobaculia bacterium]